MGNYCILLSLSAANDKYFEISINIGDQDVPIARASLRGLWSLSPVAHSLLFSVRFSLTGWRGVHCTAGWEISGVWLSGAKKGSVPRRECARGAETQRFCRDRSATSRCRSCVILLFQP